MVRKWLWKPKINMGPNLLVFIINWHVNIHDLNVTYKTSEFGNTAPVSDRNSIKKDKWLHPINTVVIRNWTFLKYKILKTFLYYLSVLSIEMSFSVW